MLTLEKVKDHFTNNNNLINSFLYYYKNVFILIGTNYFINQVFFHRNSKFLTF